MGKRNIRESYQRNDEARFQCVHYDFRGGHCRMFSFNMGIMVHAAGCYGKCSHFYDKNLLKQND